MTVSRDQVEDVSKNIAELAEEKNDPLVHISEAKAYGGGSVILYETYVSLMSLGCFRLRHAYKILKVLKEKFPDSKLVIII